MINEHLRVQYINFRLKSLIIFNVYVFKQLHANII